MRQQITMDTTLPTPVTFNTSAMISSTPAVIEEEKVSHDIHDGSYITATNSMILYCMYMTIVYVCTNSMYVSLTQLTL